jgi:hypothetical protein
VERRLVLLMLLICLIPLSERVESGAFVDCDATIYKDLIDNPRIEGDRVDFDQLDWTYSDLPMVITNSRCMISDSVIESKSTNAKNLTTAPQSYSTADTPRYFFYIGECDADLFCISWNGHQESNYAQWLITENSRVVVIKGRTCFDDSRVTVCLQ